MNDEEAGLIRCNRYFDIVDTVLNKIKNGFKQSEEYVLRRDDWDILSEHIVGLNEVLLDYYQLTGGEHVEED